jgi:DNA-binding transcriptional LysR family regulator
MKQFSAVGQQPSPALQTCPDVELRLLRYLVTVADAGTFTHAAERIFVAQPTLSQQIRRLEQVVGTPLLDRQRGGVQLTAAGRVLLEEARTILSLMEHWVQRSRQAAGLGRLRLTFAMPSHLPEALAANVTARLQSAAAAAGIDVTWLEAPVDAGFSQIRAREADSALGWLTSDRTTLPVALDAMTLGRFEPEAWLPAPAAAGCRPVIGLAELAGMNVVHGPREVSPATYDAWLGVLRAVRPGFEFTDPPSRHSLPVALAFAASAERPTAVLTSPVRAAGDEAAGHQSWRATEAFGMVRARIDQRPLTATAALIWNSDLPQRVQQVLFDVAPTPIVLSQASRKGGKRDRMRAVTAVEGQFPGGAVAADQQVAVPGAAVADHDPGPVVIALSLGALAGRELLPGPFR